MTKEQAAEKLAKAGQTQVLRYYDELNEKERRELLSQIERTDFEEIQTAASGTAQRGLITPIQAMEREYILKNRKEYLKTGRDAIAEGAVGAVLLAGGMGTRLGTDGPKGTFDIGITKPVSIFSRLMENLKEVSLNVTLFVMTSDKNHDVTVKFFEEHNYFDYPRNNVFFFRQAMAPATDFEGRVLLEERWKIATSPNGNGGWFDSLVRAGLMEVIRERNIRWLNVFAVDNVLQKMADPLFVGATIAEGYTCGAKVIRKANPDEKVGVICLEDGRPSIVEYYELSDGMRHEKDANGNYCYNFGVILNYLFRVDKLLEIREKKLPLHVVDKKIACLDENGKTVQPEEPNGHKYETLILDMIHMMDDTLAFEVVREEEFAPIKNKTGVDSVESARKLLALNGIEL